MTRKLLLVDEIPTRQDAHCACLSIMGADIVVDDEPTEDDEEPAWGSNPFDILAHKEETGTHD